MMDLTHEDTVTVNGHRVWTVTGLAKIMGYTVRGVNSRIARGTFPTADYKLGNVCLWREVTVTSFGEWKGHPELVGVFDRIC